MSVLPLMFLFLLGSCLSSYSSVVSCFIVCPLKSKFYGVYLLVSTERSFVCLLSLPFCLVIENFEIKIYYELELSVEH